MTKKVLNMEPLTKEEIVVALEKSGYPLELEVSDEFHAEGMETRLGVRMPIGGGRWKDVDLQAHAQYAVGKGDDVQVQGTASAFIQVKRLHEPATFVGIASHRTSPEAELINRCKIAGVPSFACGEDETTELLFGEDGVMALMRPFLEMPVCLQWAVVARNEKNVIKAEAPFPFYEDIQTLAIARAIAAASFSLKSRRSEQPPAVSVCVPALILDTPTLYVYEPKSRDLQRLPMLSIHQSFDGPGGPLQAVIDVVARGECRRYARMCCATRDGLKAFATRHAEELVKFAGLARARQRQRDIEQAFDDHDARRGPSRW